MKKNEKDTEEEKRIYLLVVDSTDEFSVAVDYACDFAKRNDARIALLNVMQLEHVDHWQNIENKLKSEMRAEAENMIWAASKQVHARTGQFPMVCIEEGVRSDIIIDIIAQNPNICTLILAADKNSSKPGPLVTYFSSGKGLARLDVPLMIVPGHLQEGIY